MGLPGSCMDALIYYLIMHKRSSLLSLMIRKEPTLLPSLTRHCWAPHLG